MIKNKTGLFVSIVAVFFSACTTDLHQIEQKFEGKCWGVTDTLTLKCHINEPQGAARYELYIPIHFEKLAYPYNNIHLKLLTEGEKGKKVIYPLEFSLMDKLGNWRGESKGETIKLTLIFPSQLQLKPRKEAYEIKLLQNMREKQLCGILSAGIELKKIER